MGPFIKYLDWGELPSDKNEAKKISSKAGNYLYGDGVLFKREKSTPWLRCIGQEEEACIIEEIHHGNCSTHERVTTLANKIFRQGYYLPILKTNAKKFMKHATSTNGLGEQLMH